MKIEDLKGCFANVNDDNLLRENGLLYAENKELKQEIERLNNKIHDISETLNETYNDRTELRNENQRLNNIIDELEKWAEGYIFADIFKDKIKELKENKK